MRESSCARFRSRAVRKSHVTVRVEHDGNWRQRVAKARPQGASTRVYLEKCTMRRAHDPVSRRIEIGMPSPCHRSAVVRTRIRPRVQRVSLSYDEHRDLAGAPGIEPTRRPVPQFVQRAEPHRVDLTAVQWPRRGAAHPAPTSRGTAEGIPANCRRPWVHCAAASSRRASPCPRRTRRDSPAAS